MIIHSTTADTIDKEFTIRLTVCDRGRLFSKITRYVSSRYFDFEESQSSIVRTIK